MVLCEQDPRTADAIEAWRESLPELQRARVESWRDDWRLRFTDGFDEALRKSAADLTLVSFDPYAFNVAGRTKNKASMSPEDIGLCGAAIEPHPSVLVQISTYSTNGGNSLQKVRTCWKACFEEQGFRPVITLMYERRGMMTAFFAKGQWPASRVPKAVMACLPEINGSFEHGVAVMDRDLRA